MAETEQDAGAAPNLNEPTFDVQLSDLQNDSSSPLSSASTFEQLKLKDEILAGLYEVGFQKPSKVQANALPLMLGVTPEGAEATENEGKPRNMIAQSQSGTGKTAAFVITLLSRIDLSNPTQPQALVLAPSRELARQIQAVIEHIGKFALKDIEQPVAAAIKGTWEKDQKVQSPIVVGTPGTVIDLCRFRQLDASQMKVLVIDEADNMLDQQGLKEQCLRVKKVLPKTTQILLFSATFPDVVMNFAKTFAPDACLLTLAKQDLTVKGISQMFMDCPSEADKYSILCKLYGLMNVGSSMIFVKTRESASKIQESMTNDGHKVSVLHGAYDGAERDKLLDEFRKGTFKVLIATDVLSRGIDVSTVSMVINYDIPMKGVGAAAQPDDATYLHRIGRTGRFGRVGVSITFVADKKGFDSLSYIADKLEIELVRLSPEDWDETEELVQRVIKSSRAQAAFVPSATS